MFFALIHIINVSRQRDLQPYIMLRAADNLPGQTLSPPGRSQHKGASGQTRVAATFPLIN